MKRSLLAFSVVALAACEPEPSYDAGYIDGYAATYNTACNLRTTFIDGNWDSADYSRGYANGATDAALEVADGACRR